MFGGDSSATINYKVCSNGICCQGRSENVPRGGVKLDHLGHADSVRWRLTASAAGIAERIPIYRSWVLSKLVVERVMAQPALSESMAFAVHLQDVNLMSEPVEECCL